MHKIKIGGFMKLHPHDALMAHLCVPVLGYLSVVGLLVHDVLEIRLGSFQQVDSSLTTYRQLVNSVRLHISTATSTQ
jgi:hypothetical protein